MDVVSTPRDERTAVSGEILEMPKSSSFTSGAPSVRAAEEEVRGLEVAVQDAGAVRLGERLAGLEGEVDGRRDVERPARDDAHEVLPFEELHHDVRAPGRQATHVEDARDVLASDHRGRARLAVEAVEQLTLHRDVVADHLDGDALPHREMRRGDHEPDPAAPDDALDAVLLVDDGARERRGRDVLFVFGGGGHPQNSPCCATVPAGVPPPAFPCE